MMLGFFCLNFMITFFLTWFPSYLVEERGFNLLKLGVFGLIPPLAAILGSLAGGVVGDYLLKRGWSLNKARKTCLVGGMLVCSVIALAAIAPEAWQALVLMSISYAAAAFTIVSIWCLPADVVDSSTVATLGRHRTSSPISAAHLAPSSSGRSTARPARSKYPCYSPRRSSSVAPCASDC